MEINYIAVLVAAVVQFIIGAIWYTPIFGKLWARIHDFDTKSPEVQAEMRSKMVPLLFAQFLSTLVTSFVFVLLLKDMAQPWHAYGFAGFLWLGFVVPTQVGAVLFGGTPPQWIVKKLLVMSFGSLACLMGLAFVISMMS